MRVAYFALTDFDRPSGARTHTVDFLRALGESGHEVRAVLTGSPCNPDLPHAVQVNWIPAPRKSLQSLFVTYRRAAGELRTAARCFHPELYYERESPFDPFVWRTVRQLKWPAVLEINGLVTEDLRLHGASWRGVRLASWLQHQKCRAADLIVCGASGWARWLEQTYRLPAHRAVFVPNGVFPAPFLSADRSAARERLGFAADAFVVGFVGSFNQYADLATVIRGIKAAHAQEPRVRGYFLGSGLRRAESEALVRALGAELFIRFAGPVPHEAIPEHMAALDCGVAPMIREWLDQMRCWHATTKVAEYLAAGLPIIAFDLPESDSQGTMAEVSIAVRPGDVDAVARTILMLAGDRARWQRMSAAAREMALQKRSWSHTVAGVFQALEQSQARPGPSRWRG